MLRAGAKILRTRFLTNDFPIGKLYCMLRRRREFFEKQGSLLTVFLLENRSVTQELATPGQELATPSLIRRQSRNEQTKKNIAPRFWVAHGTWILIRTGWRSGQNKKNNTYTWGAVSVKFLSAAQSLAPAELSYCKTSAIRLEICFLIVISGILQKIKS